MGNVVQPTSNQRGQFSLGKYGLTLMGCLVTNQFEVKPYCSYQSLTCLGISSLIGSLSWSNWAILNLQGMNGACDSSKRKWLASTRDLNGTLNSFLRELVTLWSLQSCVDNHTVVMALCRRALLSSALGKKYWQLIMTPKWNPFKRSTNLWRKK